MAMAMAMAIPLPPSSLLPLLPLALLVIVAASLTARILVNYGDDRRRKKKYHPIAGTMFNQLLNFGRLHHYMTDLAQKHSTYRLLSPFRNEVYTSDPANVEYILKTNFDNYGKGSYNYTILKDLLGDGIFTVDGEKWRHQRKVSSYEFSTKVLRDFSSVIFRRNAAKLAGILSEAAKGNQIIDIQDLFMRSTLDSIFKVAFGVELDSMCGSDQEGAEFSAAFDDASAWTLWRYVDIFWRVKKLLNIGSEAKLKKQVKVIDNFVYKLIRNKIELMKNLEDDSSMKKDDILSRFLQVTDTNPTELRDIILNFIIAGKDTTATTLSWFIYMVCKHPDVQEKVVQELNKVTRINGSLSEFANSITEEVLERMQYLHATITETLRLYPAVPVDAKICFSDDTLPDGFSVRKGDMVSYQPYAMGRMKFIWGNDAEEFRPERWLDGDGKFQQESPFKFTAFQAGPRICLGKEFAYRQMKIFSAVLLGCFSFRMADERKEVNYRTMINLHIDGGLHVLVSGRQGRASGVIRNGNETDRKGRMGLISGIFLGTVFGITLMAAWKHMMAYRSSKRISKAVDIKLLGSLSRDDLKKICGDNFPEWISFPVFEQVKWMNKQLSKLWPFVADAATLVIKESVEPLLEQYRPPGITSLKFSKLSLGTVPPKIEGIRVQSLKKGQITMDIDFRWGGDPSIILGVEAALVASIPIQLKDLQVFTVIRVIFQLAEEIPCISAVVVALLSEPKPRIDYTLKAVGGSLTAVPGISDMIDDTVNSIVTDMLQWPHRIVVPLGGIPVDTSELELKPQGKLTLTIVKANDLKNMEMIGKSDPYVVVHIRPLFKLKTKVIDNNLNPVWDQTFELIAEDKETQFLTIEVFDKDIGQDKRLGITKLPLIDLEAEMEKEIELRLLPSLDMLKIKDKKDRGTITLKVLYHEFNKEEQLEALEAEKRILEERKRLKEAGVIGSTMDALDGAASLVGSGIGAGVGLVGTGIGAGVGLVGSGLGAGVGVVGSGLGAVGSGLTKAGKFMGRSITGHSSASRRSGSTTPVNNGQENGGASARPT